MKYLFILIIMLVSITFNAQLEEEKTFKVPLNLADEKIEIEVDNTKKKISPDSDKIYHWFKSQEVHSSQGDYSGKLLNGSYLAHYKSNQLKEKGEFSFGLKHGVWTEWYESGEKKSVTNWKNGSQHGQQQVFSETGEATVSKYKNGEAVEKEVPVKAEKEEKEEVKKTDSTEKPVKEEKPIKEKKPVKEKKSKKEKVKKEKKQKKGKVEKNTEKEN